MTSTPTLTEHQALTLVAAILDMAEVDHWFMYSREGALCYDLDLPDLDPEEARWHLERFAARFVPKPLKDREAPSTDVGAVLQQPKTTAERARAYRQRKKRNETSCASRDASRKNVTPRDGELRLIAAE